MAIPASIAYPYHIDEGDYIVQLFPYKTFAMVISFVTLLVISALTRYLFVNLGLKEGDILKVYQVKCFRCSKCFEYVFLMF